MTRINRRYASVLGIKKVSIASREEHIRTVLAPLGIDSDVMILFSASILNNTICSYRMCYTRSFPYAFIKRLAKGLDFAFGRVCRSSCADCIRLGMHRATYFSAFQYLLGVGCVTRQGAVLNKKKKKPPRRGNF